MVAKIDDRLNLIIPVERGSSTVFIHSTPISRDAFEAHFRLIAATHADMFGRGGGYANVAPKVAALTLRDVGKQLALGAGEVDADGKPSSDGGASSLLAEIKRLSVVAYPAAEGWKIDPVDVAVQRSAIDDEEWRTAEAAIVFFTCLSWMMARKEANAGVKLFASATGLRTSALPPSEWMNSLPKSTPEEPSQPQPEVQSPQPAPVAAQRTTPMVAVRVAR
jgi:hypothetical protein